MKVLCGPVKIIISVSLKTRIGIDRADKISLCEKRSCHFSPPPVVFFRAPKSRIGKEESSYPLRLHILSLYPAKVNIFFQFFNILILSVGKGENDKFGFVGVSR